MEKSVLLKWLIAFGGYFEIFLGFIFIFMDIFLNELGFTTAVPLFSQILGVMTICFGLLLVYSNKDIAKYSIIPKVNCLMRFLVQPFAIYNIIIIPELFPIIFGAAIYDIAWAIMVLFLLKKTGI